MHGSVPGRGPEKESGGHQIAGEKWDGEANVGEATKEPQKKPKSPQGAIVHPNAHLEDIDFAATTTPLSIHS